ncbi:unnamed protein product [Danaus chrysippus]|uniref:Sucrose-6-phosphate hydrolase n=1 Tax=Danaus chrysippus TaxID=151541 RepID=A0A8J2RCT8_9NEOP|nr:unnamed protein product [Danaus chrysippus]
MSCFYVVTAVHDSHEQMDSIVVHRRHTSKKKYRPIYHITSPEGWISNPTGIAFFKRQYHIFFQYHPYNGAWGHMSWGHVVSKNLIDWTHYPSAVMPKDVYDRNGCLSGSALVINNFLTLFYTGHLASSNEVFQTQNIATSGDGVIFKKYIYNPIIRQSPNGVGDFRNPKVWRFRNLWYMVVGTSSRERFGELLLYSSTDIFNWKLNGTFVKSYGDMGYMWENPDLFELDGQHVLIISVQGIEADGFRFRNLYQTGYVVGTFNYLKGKFEDLEVSIATFNQLDYGHDFYGAKTLLATDGRRILIAWLGMWESDFIESTSGWASMLTTIREVRVNKRGRILMTPISEMEDLRVEMMENAWYYPEESFQAGAKSFELLVNSSSMLFDTGIVLEWNFGTFTIGYSAEHEYISIDRGGPDGVRRAYWSPTNHIFMRIFIDYSSIEIFCGDGEVVFSSRFYPKSMRIKVIGKSQLHITQYRLRRSIGYDKELVNRLKNS